MIDPWKLKAMRERPVDDKFKYKIITGNLESEITFSDNEIRSIYPAIRKQYPTVNFKLTNKLKENEHTKENDKTT